MHFGEKVDEPSASSRCCAPAAGIDTVITADTYGQGEADRLLGRAIEGVPRDDSSPGRRRRPRLLRGRARRPEGLPALHRPRPARRRRLRRLPADGDRAQPRAARHRPLRPADAPQPRPHRLHARAASGTGWPRCARPGLTDADRRRARAGERLHPRPARLLRALRRRDRLGDGDPQPVRALARRAGPRRRRRARRSSVITRVVDYGGLLLGRRRPGHSFAAEATTASSAPTAGSRPASTSSPRSRRSRAPRPDADAARLPVEPGQPAVACVAPTLIQEDRRGRALDRGQAGRARRPARSSRSSAAEVAEIRAIGDNIGSMALKGASPEHEGEPRPDRWPLDEQLAETAGRWGVEPERDLVKLDG